MPGEPRSRIHRAPAATARPVAPPAPNDDAPAKKAIPPRKPQGEPDAGYVAVGRVLAPFGLQGELKVQSLTDNPDRFRVRAKLWAGQQPVSVEASREAAGHLYLKFKGYGDRTSVERFRHAILQIPENALPPLPEGEYYRFQLIGLAVVTADGASLGVLEEIIETGANDVYRVRTPEGSDILLPALDDVILGVDLAARRMTVDPPTWR